MALQRGDLLEAKCLSSEALRFSSTYYETVCRNLEVLRSRLRMASATTAGGAAQRRSVDWCRRADSWKALRTP